jgi:membrane-associated phospholipid phosphatase
MSSARGRPAWLSDAERVDAAVYAAVATTAPPALDRAMRRLASAADYSRLSLAAAGALAVTRGRRGRRAAALGLASVGVTSAVVNLAVKPLTRRRRPDRDLHGVPLIRHVPMPASRSFPSGHAAAAFAFATGVGHVLPREAAPLRTLAAAVGYSRVHTGVHFPGDVVLGALLGTALAQGTTHALDRRAAP